MSPKKLIGIGATIGSILGSYVPTLWGDSDFSTASILFAFFGGMLGIFIAYKIAQNG